LFIWGEGCTPFIHQFFIHWEEGLHNFSSIEERVTKLFIHRAFIHWEECYTTFHPLRRGLQTFSSIELSSIEKSVTQLCIHQQDSDAVALGLLNSWLCLLTRTRSLVTRNT
jgi:hypothetical protein